MTTTPTTAHGPLNMLKLWTFIKNNPDVTTVEMQQGLPDMTVGVISSVVTQMYRRGMVTRKRRTFIRADNARQQSLWEYVAVGRSFEKKEVVLVPLNGKHDCIPVAGAHVPKPALMVPQIQQVVNPIPPQTTTLPSPLVKQIPEKVLSEAEQFAAFLEFKQMKKAGLI
jgi:hypothetical protein